MECNLLHCQRGAIIDHMFYSIHSIAYSLMFSINPICKKVLHLYSHLVYSAIALLDETINLSPHENILSIELINIHYICKMFLIYSMI
jgi:hypothetical protein